MVWPFRHPLALGTPRQGRQGSIRGGGGRGGVWDPKVCVPKMAQPDFPNGKFRFFPTMIT